MAIIKKTIKGLRPGADYLFTTKPKNTEVSASDNPPDAIRVTVPLVGSPGTISNLQVTSRFESLLITFNPVINIDLDYYEFQIFQNSTATGLPIGSRESLVSDGVYISGFNKSNSFTFSVTNSAVDLVAEAATPSATPTVVPENYWVRVRSVNTLRVAGEWSNLVEAGQTPLIGEQYIGTINANRITTGTLQGATINMDGEQSLMKSTVYDFAASPTQGWFIRGDGHFSLGGDAGINYSGSSITLGSSVIVQANVAANSISVGSGGNILSITPTIGGIGGMSVGDFTYNYWLANGTFRVGGASNYVLWNGSSLQVQGVLNATSGTISGNMNVNSTLIVGTTGAVRGGQTDYATGTGFFLGYSGGAYKFSIGSASSFLRWDGSSLSFTGSITGATGTFSGALSGATGSIGANFTIGDGCQIGGNLRVNGAGTTGGTTALRTRSEDSTSSSYAFVAENSAGTNILEIRGDSRTYVTGSLFLNGSAVLSTASTIDADTLDGINSTGFVQTSGTQTIGGAKTFSSAVVMDTSLDVNGTHIANTFFRSSAGGTIPSYSTQAGWSSSTSGGTLGKYTSSSIRYKENITTNLINSLDPKKLLDIPVIQFNYKQGVMGEGDSLVDRTVIGFLAEDFQQKYPVAVLYDEDGLPENIYDRSVIAGMLKLIQDLYSEIEALKSNM